jgi:Putative peptidoglycan binding domain
MEKLLHAPIRVIFALFLILPTIALAHGGGLDASGCHNDRQRGGRHCHNSDSSPLPLLRAPPVFRNLQPSFLGVQPKPIKDVFDGRLEAIQKMLKHLGYDPGLIDGRQGEMTRDAIRQFQKENGSPETGEANADLVDQLILAIDR